MYQLLVAELAKNSQLVPFLLCYATDIEIVPVVEEQALVRLLLACSAHEPSCFELLVSEIATIYQCHTNENLQAFIVKGVNQKNNEGVPQLLAGLISEGSVAHIHCCLDRLAFLDLDYISNTGNTFLHELTCLYGRIYNYPARHSFDMDGDYFNKKVALYADLLTMNMIVDRLVLDRGDNLKKWTREKLAYNGDGLSALHIFIKDYNATFFKDITITEAHAITEEQVNKEVPFFLDTLIYYYPKSFYASKNFLMPFISKNLHGQAIPMSKLDEITARVKFNEECDETEDANFDEIEYAKGQVRECTEENPGLKLQYECHMIGSPSTPTPSIPCVHEFLASPGPIKTLTPQPKHSY